MPHCRPLTSLIVERCGRGAVSCVNDISNLDTVTRPLAGIPGSHQRILCRQGECPLPNHFIWNSSRRPYLGTNISQVGVSTAAAMASEAERRLRLGGAIGESVPILTTTVRETPASALGDGRWDR